MYGRTAVRPNKNMAYSTLTDIIKLLPESAIIQLTDDEGDGVVNESRVNEAIAQADAEIDSYCGGIYTVPFATVPDIVKKISVDIAIYNLYSRKVETIPETRAERYKNAIRQLTDISKGVISLGIDPAPAQTGSGVNNSIKSNTRLFSRSGMEDL